MRTAHAPRGKRAAIQQAMLGAEGIPEECRLIGQPGHGRGAMGQGDAALAGSLGLDALDIEEMLHQRNTLLLRPIEGARVLDPKSLNDVPPVSRAGAEEAGIAPGGAPARI